MTLEVRGVSKQFGSLQVIRGVTMQLDEGARCALIGPNGAGKTTAFNVITRLYAPDEAGQRNVVTDGTSEWQMRNQFRAWTKFMTMSL